MRHRFVKLARTLKLGLVLTEIHRPYSTKPDVIISAFTGHLSEKNNTGMIQNQCFPSGLYCSIWKCAVILHTWQESQQLPFLPGSCGFLPLFHLKLHSFTSKVPPLFTAHFLPFSSQPWERVYSAARAARKKRVDFFDLSIMRKNALISLWL